MPLSARYAALVVQLVAVPCYILWLVWVAAVAPPKVGLLSSPATLHASAALFLVPAAVWPFAARLLVQNRRSAPAVSLSVVCLLLTASGAWMQAVGTFQGYESPRAPPRFLIVPLVFLTSVVDGIGWSAYAIRGLLGD